MPSKNTTRPVALPTTAARCWLEALERRRLLSAAYDLIGLTALRNDPTLAGIDGGGVSVAVIDTGLDATHPLLAPNVLATTDVTAAPSTATITSPHGTHVAGIIASRPDPSRGFDGGVAPRAGLVGINIFTRDASGAVAADNRSLEKALQWVIDNRQRYRIVAVNLSLGSGFYTSPQQVQGDVYSDEIQTLQDSGVTVVAAAGNSYGIIHDPGSGRQLNVQFPNSASPGIISTLNVGAVWDANQGGGFVWSGGSVDLSTAADRLVSFSQRPPPVAQNAIFAPGAIITSTWPGNQIQSTQGTSQAAPMVSGAVALMQDAAMTFGGRLLSATEVRSIQQASGDPITDGDDEDDAIFIDDNHNGLVDAGELRELLNTGLSYVRLNVLRAVQRVRELFGGGSSTPTDPNGTISSAIFGPTLTGAPVGPIPGTLGTDGSRSIGSDDVDMYEFTVASPGTISIEIGRGTSSAGVPDSYLRLFDASGVELAADDDSAGDALSRIVISLPPGTYYAGVSGAGNTGYDPISGAGTRAGAIGNFTISFALSNLDPNGLLSGAVNVNLAGDNEPHQNFDGFIGADLGKPVGPADVDLFRIVVPDNGRLMVDIDTPYDTDYVNSYLRVFDAQGNPISDNDAAVAHDAQGNPLEMTDGLFSYDLDSGDPVGHATDSFAIGQVRRGEVYYFGVSDAANRNYNPTSLSGRSSAGGGGFYRIFVSFANNDRNGAISQAVETTLPLSPRPGAVGADGGEPVGDRDVDFFRVQPDESGILEINVDSYSLAGNPSPVNAVLRLFASDGRLLASSDDIDGPDPLLRAPVVGGQVYFIGVSGAGNDNYDPQLLGSGSPGTVGDYRISMRLRPRSIVARLWDDRLDAPAVRSIQLNSALTANLGMDLALVRGSTDVDLYRFLAPASGPIQVRAGALSSFGADTFVRIFDATGREITYNDNADPRTVDSLIYTGVVRGQTYFIGVSGAGRSPRAYDPVRGAGAASGSTGDYQLSISSTFAAITGKRLRIYGTNDRDSIGVRLAGGKVKVTCNGQTVSFPASRVRGVSIAARAGNDWIAIDAGTLPVSIDAGGGDDVVRSGGGDDLIVAGQGVDRIFAGAGNDRVFARDSLADLILDGGEGADSAQLDAMLDLNQVSLEVLLA
ncbi:S8 family serine peptidase [Fontivita pretiosa]|uniref:S8 family serine peptidase n=1 Tax=Fontivita pretiosa TaxID=2989684 RepID=UPI003D182787